jgi:nucleotide-binding universal stress UspA family protein
VLVAAGGARAAVGCSGRPHACAGCHEAEAHRRLLNDATRTLSRREIVATTVEPTGDTVESIVDAARKAQADLIVVGSRQHRLLDLLLAFRSVSTKVVVEAPCDVLVVR